MTSTPNAVRRPAGSSSIPTNCSCTEPDYEARAERIAEATASFLERPPLDRFASDHAAAQARRADGRAHWQHRSSVELLERIVSLIPSNESDFVSLFIGSSVSPVVLGSLQAGLVEIYGQEATSSGGRS